VSVGSVIVKIYRVKNKGGIRFTVSHFSNGRRTMKMFTDFDKAKTHAKNVAEAMDSGKVDVVELRGRARTAYLHTLELLAPTGIALEFAAADYVEARRLLGGKASLVEAAREYVKRHLHALPDKMLPDAVEEMLADKEREGVSKVYLNVLRVYLGQLAKAFHCQVRSVTASQLGDYFRGMDVSARSKNNSRQTVGTFFKYCRERGWLPKDHDGIALVPKFKEQAKGIEIFTPSEMSQFLRYARPEMVPFLAIGAFAGLRSAEIERLDWAEVRLTDRFIEVQASKAKTASRRLVPVTENLAKWLTPHAQNEGRVVPFDYVAKEIGSLVEETNAGLKDAVKAAGRDPEKATQAKWKKNALRHSFISYRVADIQNVAQVALEAGNSPQMIFKNYREVVRPAEAKAWFAIEPNADSEMTPLPAAGAKATAG
jgi:integrase